MLLDLPYAERQLIVVVDDQVAKAQSQAEREVKERAVSTNKQVNWNEVMKTAMAIAVPVAVGAVAAGAVVGAVIEGLKAQYRLRERGINVASVGRSEASHLRLPPGHPRDGVLYIGHPGIPSIYYTTAQFHRLTFEHKFAEAIRLLMALGATELEVEHISGWSREFSAKLSVPLTAVPVEVGASAGAKQGSDAHLLFRAELKGTQSPGLPSDLVWYPHEPMWQQLTEGRLQFGLKNFSLSVRYEDDFGVNAGLKVAATNAGLELGGNFEDHQSTVWQIVAKFNVS